MQNTEGLSPAQMAQFLAASQEIEFTGQSRREVYGWVQQIVVQQEYFRQGKKQRGVIRAYLSKVTGLSLVQITRLMRQYQIGRASCRERV